MVTDIGKYTKDWTSNHGKTAYFPYIAGCVIAVGLG